MNPISAETRTLASLLPRVRDDYGRVAAQLRACPAASAQLRTMLLEGRLKRPLLSQLAAIASEPLATGLDRTELLIGLIAKVADPACEAPAEHARRVLGLSSRHAHGRLLAAY